jgi:hypothetical protein
VYICGFVYPRIGSTKIRNGPFSCKSIVCTEERNPPILSFGRTRCFPCDNRCCGVLRIPMRCRTNRTASGGRNRNTAIYRLRGTASDCVYGCPLVDGDARCTKLYDIIQMYVGQVIVTLKEGFSVSNSCTYLGRLDSNLRKAVELFTSLFRRSQKGLLMVTFGLYAVGGPASQSDEQG